MITIEELVNKIKWDKKEHPEDYVLYYLDRISGDLKEIKFTDIKEKEGKFIIIEREDKDVEIPLHRIKAVKRKDIVVWKRAKFIK